MDLACCLAELSSSVAYLAERANRSEEAALPVSHAPAALAASVDCSSRRQELLEGSQLQAVIDVQLRNFLAFADPEVKGFKHLAGDYFRHLHPRSTACAYCGRLYFPASLRVHQERCPHREKKRLEKKRLPPSTRSQGAQTDVDDKPRRLLVCDLSESLSSESLTEDDIKCSMTATTVLPHDVDATMVEPTDDDIKCSMTATTDLPHHVDATVVEPTDALSASRDADSFYVQDCRQVQNNTHSIQTLTGQISKLVGTMEAEKDFQHCRKMVDEAVRQASETKTILARIREHQHQAQNTAERNNRRMMYQKLSDNLAITARVLEDVVRRFTAEERRRVGGGVLETPSIAAADAAGGNDQKPLLSTPEMEAVLQTDKVQTLRKVDEDMLCLQRIYTDLASAAEEQSCTFDSLESHMARAAADVERGREEIEYTDKYNMAAKLKRRLWLAAGGLLAVMVFGTVISSGCTPPTTKKVSNAWNGWLDERDLAPGEDELIKMNEKVSLLHYGKDGTDKQAIREKFQGVFREQLDPNGQPVPFSVFRDYMQGMLMSIDPNPDAQVMMVEQFIAEAESAREAFRFPSLVSESDQFFFPEAKAAPKPEAKKEAPRHTMADRVADHVANEASRDQPRQPGPQAAAPAAAKPPEVPADSLPTGHQPEQTFGQSESASGSSPAGRLTAGCGRLCDALK
ncbi:unnamed protein product [Effrenium voratum]|nr:unnamed protein product [Effrenium voratum]